MFQPLAIAAHRVTAIAAFIGVSLLGDAGDSRAQSTAEEEVLSEAITFHLTEMRSHFAADRIVVDIGTAIILRRATEEVIVGRETAGQVARFLGGTVGDLSELMTCPKGPIDPPLVTLRDCSLPDGTVVFVIERPDVEGDTAVVTLQAYKGEPGVPYVSVESLKVQLAREFDGWRVSKILGRAAS